MPFQWYPHGLKLYVVRPSKLLDTLLALLGFIHLREEISMVQPPLCPRSSIPGLKQQLVDSVKQSLSMTYAKLVRMGIRETDQFSPNNSPMALWLSSGVPLVLTSKILTLASSLPKNLLRSRLLKSFFTKRWGLK